MKRIIFGILICFGAGVLFCSIPTDEVSAVGWADNQVQVVGKNKLLDASPSNSYPCDGIEASAQIEGFGVDRKACVYGNSSQLRMVRFVGNSIFRYGISFPNNDVFYEVRGLCPYPRCVYSSASDSLLVHHYLPSWRFGVGLYKEFSKSLKRYFDNSTQRYYYQFEPAREPDYSLKIGDTEPSSEALNFSLNGKWAIIELRAYGFVRLNIETLEARRVIAPGASYGLFNDPSYELAISNDGRYIATTGFRASTALFEVNAQCGDYVQSLSSTSFSPYVLVCRQIHFDTNALLTDMFHGFNPRFNDAGDRLGISVLKSSGDVERVILASKTPQPTRPAYLALGDSFTSGEGELDDAFYRSGSNNNKLKCHVSKRSYPYLVGNDWNIETENVACSGARTKDILVTQDYQGQSGALDAMSEPDKTTAKQLALDSFQAGVIPQLDFVSRYQPEMITVSIGGNDAGLIGKLSACLGVDTCEWANNPTKRFASAKEISNIYFKVREVIRNIRIQSPGSRVLVVGYPQIIDSTDTAKCDALTGVLLNSTERTFMNESVSYLNQVVKKAALSENVQFMDINKSLKGHELCGRTNSVAMNTIRIGDDIAPLSFLKKFRIIGSESFHPTPTGHQMIARDILDKYPNSGYVSECEGCESSPEAPDLPPYWNNYSEDQYVRQVYEPAMSKPVLKLKELVSILTPAHLFMPNSAVRAEVHSEVTPLGNGIAEEDGSFNLQVVTPANMEPGYHTLHLFGTGPNGKQVDVYDVVAIESDKTTIDVVNDTTNVPKSSIITESSINNNKSDVAQSPSYNKDSSNNPGLKTLTDSLAVLGISTYGDSLVSPAPTTTKGDDSVKQNGVALLFIFFMGMLILCAMIYIIILANLMRHSSREPSG